MNSMLSHLFAKSPATLEVAEKAVRAIPPVWPLSSSVAVNPYLGQTGETLAKTGARLARATGARVTMPRSWYAAKIANGEIIGRDLDDALAATPEGKGLDVAALKAAVARQNVARRAAPTVADLAADESGVDWPRIVADRVGAWAAAYFDEGQALWAAPRGKSAWSAWRGTATHDLTPEVLGLDGFAAFVADAPDEPDLMIARAVDRLGLSAQMSETYFHQLLATLGGWSQVARWKLWRAELAGRDDRTTLDLLAIRLSWELALYDRFEDAIAARWSDARSLHAVHLAPDADLVIDAVLQEAAERAAQRALSAAIEAPSARPAPIRPALQVALCIDVRSEVFRRALESLDARIETLGFAGFFGLSAAHRAFASDIDELRLPVLLNPGVHSCAGGSEHDAADAAARVKARGGRAWGRFKLAAVSSFAFVESAGPLYLSKLVRDGLGLARKAAPIEPAPQFAPALPLDARADAAEAILRAMSLTSSFARVVLLAGHGANVVNNPHASALACGACGGYSGEVNARLLAGLLNEPEVRRVLRDRGIEIPSDTVFLAGLHDTTTDKMTLYTDDQDVRAHTEDLGMTREWLRAAGALARGERAKRLPRATSGSAIDRRSRDWSEVRPEWALAGCMAFIAAPRSRTRDRNLEGRAFLHNYDWRADGSFKVLELIMTAPVVVASWISLQYYGSVVSPELFGGGDKTLHNVVGGIGVFEGNGGLLRVGLPWQSVHDGDRLAHDPLRLTVCIEAPCAAMSEILERHKEVRALFDNRWLHLIALDDEGRMAWRYAGDLQWLPETREAKAADAA